MTNQITPTPWRDIHNAILFWFSESTGLKTIWAKQDAPQPAWPFGILNRIQGPTKVGQDGVRHEVIDLGGGNKRLDETFCGLRQFTISCQIDLGPIGKCPGFDAGAVMAAAQMALTLPRYLERFRDAGIAVVADNDPVREFDLVIGDIWCSRANMDLRFYTAANVTEKGADYFDGVTITSNITGTDHPSIEIAEETFGG